MADIERLHTSQEIEHARSKSQITLEAEPLVQQLRELIENTRKRVASVVSDETSQLYWNVGSAINTFVLQGNRAEYGKQIVAQVARQLQEEYGSGFEEKNVRRMMQFAAEYQDMDETVWLTQQQMAQLFSVAENNITYHIRGIYKTQELEPTATAQKIRVVRQEGNRTVTQTRHFMSIWTMTKRVTSPTAGSF